MPGNATRREILFVKDRDPVQEHWRGRTLTREEARSADRHPHGAGPQPVRAFLGGHARPARAWAPITEQEAAASSTRWAPAARRLAPAPTAAAAPPIRSPGRAVRAPDARALRRLPDRRRHAARSPIFG